MAALARTAGVLALALVLATTTVAADFEAAMQAYVAGELEQAFDLWLPLAEGGDAEAQNQIGVMYGAALGVGRDDQAAAQWFGRAAAQGSVRARTNLARLYLHGLGVPQDPALAADLYKRSALTGYVKAQAALGNLYARGVGVPRDLVRAYFWWTLAAKQGDHESVVGREDAAYNMTAQQIRTGNLLVERFQPLAETVAE